MPARGARRLGCRRQRRRLPMRVLTQEDTEALLDMESCLEALEPVYVDLAAGAAGSIPRADLVVGHGQRSDAVHGLKTMSGSVPRYQIAAVRVNSDVVHWPEQHGQRRRVKLPLADGRWVGLVLLFDMATGTPLAIFPDGYVQRLRVGATNGLGSKYMAREDASALAVLGSGWQARTQVLACCAVRPIDRVTVYSPTPARSTPRSRSRSTCSSPPGRPSPTRPPAGGIPPWRSSTGRACRPWTSW